MKDRFVTIRSVENNNGRRPLVGQLSLASRHPGGPPLPPSAPPTTTTTLSYSIHPGEAFAHDLNNTLFNFWSFHFGIKLDKESFAQGVYHSSSVFEKKTFLNISYQVLFYMRWLARGTYVNANHFTTTSKFKWAFGCSIHSTAHSQHNFNNIR